MLKNSVFFGLIALAAACSDSNDRSDYTPIPTAAPTTVPGTTPAPAPAAPALPQLTAKAIESKDLPDDFGFQAVYSKIPFAMTQFPEAEALVNVTKNRVQLRKLDNREILDCRFRDDNNTLLNVEYRLEGKVQTADPFMWISCFTVRHRVLPVSNLDELCDVYGCSDDKVGEMETKNIKGQTLWIEKESHIRVQEGQDLHMKHMIPGAPAESEFTLP